MLFKISTSYTPQLLHKKGNLSIVILQNGQFQQLCIIRFGYFSNFTFTRYGYIISDVTRNE